MIFNRKNFKRWSLYFLIFFIGYILQYVILSRYPLFGIVPMLAPVAVACAAAFEGAENGGIYGICCGMFLYLGSENHGAYLIAALGLAGLAAGILCQRVLTRTLMPSFLTAVIALLIFEIPIYLMAAIFSGAGLNMLFTGVLPTVIYSALFTPLFFFPSRLVHDKTHL